MRQLSFILSILFIVNSFGQVGIGTTSPDLNTILDISSTEKGILIPRLTTSERDANLADNLSSTIYPDNTPAFSTTPAPADYLKTGTLIFNLDEKLLEYWDADAGRWLSLMVIKGFSTGNDGQVLINFPSYSDADAIKYDLSADLIADIQISADSISYDSDRNIISTNAITYVIEESVFGPLVTADFDEIDFDVSTYPTTDWPNNAEDKTKSGIWDETNKTLIENNLEGQVHFWRIVIEYEAASSNDKGGSFETSLINPNSTFTTESTTALIDGKNNEIVRSTFLFMTIADSFSLPGYADGGLGYQLGFRANRDITVSIRSILRVSLFKD